MSVIKRLSGILTPPPFRRGEKTEEPPPFVESRYEFSNQIRGWLRTLLTPETIDAPTSAHIKDEMKRLGQDKGLYATAAEIRIQIELMARRARDEGKTLHPDRGYRMAADFIVQQILKEVEGIKSTGSGFGPNILAAYCSDLYACLIDGHDVRRAIETPIMLVERILWHAAHQAAYRPALLALLDPVLAPAMKLLQQKQEQFLQKEQQLSLARRKELSKSSISSPPPSASDSSGPNDPWRQSEQVGRGLGYLRQFHSGCLSQRDTLSAFDGTGCVATDELARPIEAGRLAEHLAFLERLQKMSDHRPFGASSAALLEEMGLCLLQTDQERAKKTLLRAAQAFEAQGDEEASYGLTGLTGNRYKRALNLYAQVGDASAVARLRERMQRL